MDSEIAAKEEGNIINIYKKDNWVILNKAKAGGLGGISSKYTINDAIEDAKKYRSKTEWKKTSPIYSFALKAGIIGKCCQHMVEIKVPNNYWTKERCSNEAKNILTKKIGQ